jgi:hypothetical protein
MSESPETEVRKEKDMDQEIEALRRAMVDAAARGGLDLRFDEAGGYFSATLGRDRRGRIVLLRQPIPCEGGRRAMNHPDGTLTEGRLPDATLAWIEAWTMMDIGVAATWSGELARRGLPPSGFMADLTRVNAFAASLLSGLGHDLAGMLETAEWRPTQDGHTATIEHDAFRERATIHRHLGSLRLQDVGIAVGDATILVTDGHDDSGVTIEMHGVGRLPDAVVMGARGPLSDLATLPGDAGRHAIITTARLERDDSIVVEATCGRTTLVKGGPR